MKIFPSYSGVCLSDDLLSLHILPCFTADHVTFAVDVQPTLTGFTSGARLSDEVFGHEYPFDNIFVDYDEMTCHVAQRSLPPAYRHLISTGFSLVLESDMASQVNAWLPRIVSVSTSATALLELLEQTIPHPGNDSPLIWPHHKNYVLDMLANMLLDGSDMASAMSLAGLAGDDSKADDKRLLWALHQPEAQALIAGYRKQYAPAPPGRRFMPLAINRDDESESEDKQP